VSRGTSCVANDAGFVDFFRREAYVGHRWGSDIISWNITLVAVPAYLSALLRGVVLVG
jgi:hypothetical protein